MRNPLRRPATRCGSRPRHHLVAVAAGLGLVSGCTGAPPSAVALPSTDVTAGVTEALLPFATQQVDWRRCGARDRQCATVRVPTDYAAPSAGTIELSVARVPARRTADRIGALVLNPGGPGAPATDVLDATTTAVGDDVTDLFDIVAVDPRGVGGSSPVRCTDDATLDRWRSGLGDVGTADGLTRREGEARQLATACEQRSRSLLGHVDTISAARDLDVVRAVLGEGRLTYLGMSYGTLLGARYAELFPRRVGRFVLDAGLDPSMDETGRRLGLAASLESAVRTYVQYCLVVAPCPLSGGVDDGLDQLRAFLDRLATPGLPTGTTRPLTPGLAAAAVMVGVSEETTWPILSSALEAAWSGDGGPLLDLADVAAGRDRDGSYMSNAFAASIAITCLSEAERPAPAELPTVIDELGRASPTFGRFLADPLILCSVWPVEPAGVSTPVHARGADPILIIGTTRDPAAPYAWSLALADHLPSARLLTYDGFGHTVVGRPNACLKSAITGYLLRGELPPKATTCRARTG